ncbi:sulfite exporter TauE/SafE family protein [Streptomyces corynorhini]|uniref:Probable membrane transporter protein n=1 Tax=Streptomyces corynorhini TaxID=2282652 RepID=A0A370AYR0_9ACTN|nr:sulfite exporter TauE/SafE family protein [Streptomyces corynorhini]RDG34710.1 sulfite exporter TauE/SafE family protein [Streptomyces corynorhini]
MLTSSFDLVVVLFLFGCLTGVTTVFFGFGGGFVTVPVLYGSLTAAADSGTDAMRVAVATSTAVMLVNSLAATRAQLRAGRLRREYLWPLAAFVAAGAAVGSYAATRTGGPLLRVLFAAYLVVTIADSLLRRGFLALQDRARPVPLGRFTTTFGGVGIGAVAACLGVGGSVMTVPLLRRKGLPMADATAMASPLGVPVAVAGSVVYLLASAPAHPGRVGYVDLAACAALLSGSLPTIALVRRVAGRVPDRVHSIAYVTLLGLVLLAMAVTGA